MKGHELHDFLERVHICGLILKCSCYFPENQMKIDYI